MVVWWGGGGDWAEKEQKNTYRDKYIVVIASRNGLKLFDVRTFKKKSIMDVYRLYHK